MIIGVLHNGSALGFEPNGNSSILLAPEFIL
jgi:hypothetical protein